MRYARPILLKEMKVLRLFFHVQYYFYIWLSFFNCLIYFKNLICDLVCDFSFNDIRCASSWFESNFRSSHRRCSIEKVFWKIYRNSQENIKERVSFLTNLQTSSLNHRPGVAKFWRASFFRNLRATLSVTFNDILFPRN